ncbi:hypothetical protein SAMN05660690_4389 [Geodermatophilus telluris]|uniref:Uncharacterized protein n=1 Tax=Geodermatophilus telluris TaxID=1190417 RepID=A0A1G6VAI5_9ACTN|nr:hypothetical protein [Geodermatophilus telluris]SDD49845.1 hypothetical protein SAMN05660690_4389 [Geodermatophilus telluris]
MVWNTGLNRLRNSTGGTILFVDLEDPRYAVRLLDGWSLVNGPVFPWCENTLEVRSKAFRIHRGPSTSSTVALHLFQNYRDDTCYHIPGPGPLWSNRRGMGEGPSSYLDVVIDADFVPTAVAAVPALVPAVAERAEDDDAAHREDVERALEALRRTAGV